MIGLVLLQKSEGGGLGMAAAGWFHDSRGTSNVLTRTTAILAGLFSSLAWAIDHRGRRAPAALDPAGFSSPPPRVATGQSGRNRPAWPRRRARPAEPTAAQPAAPAAPAEPQAHGNSERYAQERPGNRPLSLLEQYGLGESGAGR